MFKMMKKRIKNEKGLTLIELLAVIVILAIVAAIAVPAIGNIIDNSRYKAVKSDAINVINAANIYFTDNPNADTVTVEQLKSSGFLDNEGKIAEAIGGANSTVAKGGSTGTGSAHELTTGIIDYDGNNNITFSGATIKQISDHEDKTDTTVGDE
ncbi:prepilin-type N-terminal cleavage/methylation domain-containing protein [Metasolibacillus meyeri]|uniref:Prepilin-type N-terminal cleavage/methylation domain-containing protein n=2 Tax=Metasolibacillus meyeri TaxID=1071052 RepID=A0AAW9NV29_9BACL|nr:prepilin-type N-terminal cleavage/methylation domain-containing protein [Metasolibacillus meyeri]